MLDLLIEVMTLNDTGGGMILVLQRVQKASVKVEGNLIADIGKGVLVLLGVSAEDDGSEVAYLSKKLVELRMFSDDQGKMNLSVKDIGGEILTIPQFTLCASTARGRRPDFFGAAKPEKGEKLYLLFVEALREKGLNVKTGVFGANMQISLINDGPVTFVLEKK